MSKEYKIMYLCCYLCFWGAIISSCASHITNAYPSPALYDLDVLYDMKNNSHNYPQLADFFKEADSIALLSPVSVMSKRKTFAPNKHFYCSISRYSWPVGSDSAGKYKIIDGKCNPEYADFDGATLESLAHRLQCLSVAFFLTNNHTYKVAFEDQIKCWFIVRRTRMLPNFEYAHVLPGSNHNMGQVYGLAELSRFTKIIESILLYNNVVGIGDTEKRKLTDWFTDFQRWLICSDQWNYIYNDNHNNITSSSFMAMVEISMITQNIKLIEKLYQVYGKQVIDAQIDAHGRQPTELSRSAGFGYSVENLHEIVDFCIVMEKMDFPLYKNYKLKIDAAFCYLKQFVNNHERFPYSQNAPWKLYEERLQKDIIRLLKLTNKHYVNLNQCSTTNTWNSSTILNLVY